MACKLCLVLACLALVASLVPGARAIPSGLLSELAGSSICESVVEYDEDPDRIPRIIKQVKCAPSPDKMCPAADGETSCCTQSSHLSYRFSCQQVIDTVLVSDSKGSTSPKVVSVGCACALTQPTTAKEITDR